MKTILTSALMLLSILFAWKVNAQSPAVQNALEGVKDQVQDLVTAKDKGENDLDLRIETFKKVIAFAVSEAKDLKVKLLGLEKLPEETELWREDIIKTMNAALEYYDFQKEQIEDAPRIDLDMIKRMASNFKEWREKNYVAAADVANSYLLIVQEQRAVDTAEKRWQRIQKDVLSIQKARVRNASKLKEMLDEAGKKISEARKKNEAAGNLFWNSHVLPYTLLVTENQTSTTSSIPNLATTTINLNPEAINSTSTGEFASSSSIFQSSSIKGLVESSLSQIKEAYQIFIEMSNLVRKLLG